ncbi:hypothetical protein AWB74_08552 [Caballeronia arvi]|uniref:Uncharacterized protein n=1 Tax=Caballeronia arvi TaxID=1777135 RepID=A0A158L4Q0_9BURK|nr:hypothetical protein AWB74_08552 [Caballeronia arvi]
MSLGDRDSPECGQSTRPPVRFDLHTQNLANGLIELVGRAFDGLVGRIVQIVHICIQNFLQRQIR